MTSTMQQQDRTEDDVDDDLEAWRREMDVAIAEVNLTSAKMALARGTSVHTEAETAHYDALRRLGELDRRRAELQAEARSFRAADDR